MSEVHDPPEWPPALIEACWKAWISQPGGGQTAVQAILDAAVAYRDEHGAALMPGSTYRWHMGELEKQIDAEEARVGALEAERDAYAKRGNELQGNYTSALDRVGVLEAALRRLLAVWDQPDEVRSDWPVVNARAVLGDAGVPDTPPACPHCGRAESEHPGGVYCPAGVPDTPPEESS